MRLLIFRCASRIAGPLDRIIRATYCYICFGSNSAAPTTSLAHASAAGAPQ